MLRMEKKYVYIEYIKVSLIKPKIKKENTKQKYQLQIRQVTYSIDIEL